ncbi:hypothetical protein GCM10010361_04390 [Streptomyces olivaceiscleroticus]|uniref:Uncharacterized protein n=1 Tax=Streptomyces olivaceiscleroticus TaxID=68245 RepID=A0ABP3JA01_9ACTN
MRERPVTESFRTARTRYRPRRGPGDAPESPGSDGNEGSASPTARVAAPVITLPVTVYAPAKEPVLPPSFGAPPGFCVGRPCGAARAACTWGGAVRPPAPYPAAPCAPRRQRRRWRVAHLRCTTV